MGYFSVQFTFFENNLNKNLVHDIYSIFFKNGFPFKSGYWEAEGFKIDEIIQWNQNLIESKFNLGYDQDIKYDYKQILLNRKEFQEVRLFWLYGYDDDDEDKGIINDELNLYMIIPESDILEVNTMNKECFFNKNKVNLIVDISLKIWESNLIELVQTNLELSYSPYLKDILNKNEELSIEPFCIISNSLYEKIPRDTNCFNVNTLKNGKLIIDFLHNP